MNIASQPQTKQRHTPPAEKSIGEIAPTIRQKLQLLKLRSQEDGSTSKQYLFACAATAHAVKVYWDHLQTDNLKVWPLPQLTLDEPIPSLDGHTQQITDFLGMTLANFDAISAGYFLGELYTALLPEDLRAKYGIFYTPPALTSRLVDLATQAGVDWTTAHVLDPACGGGAFLTPTALKIIESLGTDDPGNVLGHISTHVHGFELDPFSGWMSQVLLEAALINLCQSAGKRLPNVVTVGDALTMPVKEGEVDLVIGNPPYGRITLSPELRARYQRSLYGHANAYGLFMEMAVRWTTPGGIIAYITPTGFLGGQYFKHLRSLMSREAPPVAIDLVTSRRRVFSNVLQETLLAIYKRGGESPKAEINILELKTEASTKIESAGDFQLPLQPTDPWLIPRGRHQSSLITRLRAMPHRLKDYGYKVSTGPLVWNRHKSQLSDEAISGSFPIIWAECVTLDGKFEYRATKKNHKPFVKPQKNQQWLLAQAPCVLVQRTTAKEQRRRLFAAELPEKFIRTHGAVSIENHLNMIRPVTEDPSVSLRVIAALLNSQIVDSAFRCISGSVAVSASELESLPVPSPEEACRLDQLLDSHVASEEIEKAITELYFHGHIDGSSA